MGERDDGLTLQGLAQRLETLERENERLGELERENTGLRQKVASLAGSNKNEAVVESAWASKGPVSRRALLGKAGAAVAAVAAGTLLMPREAKATDYGDDISADYITTQKVRASADNLVSFNPIEGLNTHDVAAAVHGRNSAGGPGVRGRNEGDGSGVEGVAIGTSAYGMEGIAQGINGMGVKGTGRYGVWGESNQAGFHGVTGRNTNADGTGVRGVANNSDGRTGVRGEGSTGVWGSSPRTGYSGVYGQHTGSAGYGVVGDGKGDRELTQASSDATPKVVV